VIVKGRHLNLIVQNVIMNRIRSGSAPGYVAISIVPLGALNFGKQINSCVYTPENHPLVLAHAQALLASAPEDRTAYIRADLRDPAAILSDPVTRGVLDFGQPIGLVIVAILHFIQDGDNPAQILATLLDALPPGSYLAASHLTTEHDPVATAAGQRAMQRAGIAMRKRDSGEFARLAFRDLELVPPGVVLVSEWRPDAAGPRPTPAQVNCYGGVARKP
jgi:S-adenosyl methyltransferase